MISPVTDMIFNGGMHDDEIVADARRSIFGNILYLFFPSVLSRKKYHGEKTCDLIFVMFFFFNIPSFFGGECQTGQRIL